jgi:hypothetical protein
MGEADAEMGEADAEPRRPGAALDPWPAGSEPVGDRVGDGRASDGSAGRPDRTTFRDPEPER